MFFASSSGSLLKSEFGPPMDSVTSKTSQFWSTWLHGQGVRNGKQSGKLDTASQEHKSMR